jgi:transposase InsO family protein
LKPKCTHCKRLGHPEDRCRFKKKNQKSTSQRDKDKRTIAAAATTKKETHTTEAGSDNETLTAMDAETSIDAESFMIDDPFIDDTTEYNSYLASQASTNDDSSRLYDWLVDSGSTNHITNQRKLFTIYGETPGATIHRVGGKITQVIGRGKISLIAQYGTRKRTLHLKNVNYIPINKYNIFALGRWDSQGQTYKVYKGKLILYDRLNIPVLKGLKIASNIYPFQLLPSAIQTKQIAYTLSCTEPKQTWDTWHRRFGHVSYKGLRKIESDNLVDGFTVDTKSGTPDCIACMEAKQSVKPYAAKTAQQRHKGKLTHMDLWGKYDISSINGHQYYLLLVDDATRYVTLYFLKAKSEATQYVKNYLTHLHVRGITTHGICVDHGTKFVNKELKDWCQSKGMEIELTASYSPLQNGIAERMNRTLVELARAMLTTSKLPEFLWEPAILHAAYVRNRAYTTSIQGQTPYQGWEGTKPNVSHLREFGAPVWVLL